MGDLIVWIASESNAPILWAIVVLVLVEFGLDIVHDLFMDWWRKKRGRE